MTTKRAKDPAPVKVGDLLEGISPVNMSAPVKSSRISTRSQKRVDGLERIRLERQAEKQRLGYLARPFILCGLPFKPKKGQSVYPKNGSRRCAIAILPFGCKQLQRNQ